MNDRKIGDCGLHNSSVIVLLHSIYSLYLVLISGLTVASDTELSNSDDSSSSHITPSLKTKRKNFDRPLKRKRVASMKENDKVKRSKDSSDLSAKSQTKVGKSAVMHLSCSESSSSQSENDSVKASAKQPETQVSSDPSLVPCHSSDESSKPSAVESYFSASDNSSVSSTKSDEVVICNFVKEKTATKSGKESSDDCMEVINVAGQFNVTSYFQKSYQVFP